MISKKKTFFLLFLIFQSIPCFSAFAQPAELYNNAEISRAVSVYRRISRKPDIEGYLNLAVIFKDIQRYQQGIDVLNAARKVFGDDLRLMAYLGRLYYLDGKFDRSIAALSRLLKDEPDNQEALITMGLCWQEKSDDRKARSYFQKTLELNSENVIARLSLADIYYRQNKLAESAWEYKALNIIDASISHIHVYWADILFALKNYREALKIYEKIISLDPQNRSARERLEVIRKELGQDYFAREQAKKKVSRERKLVFVKPFPKINELVMIRIGLLSTDGSAEFKCSTDFSLKTRAGRVLLAQGRAGDSYSFRQDGSRKLLIESEGKKSLTSDEPVVISCAKPEGTVTVFDVKFGSRNFWSNSEDRSYRGQIEASAAKSGIKLVNILSLEEYLYGVIPSEMPANWPMEALKAQSVAARSESLAKLGRHKNEGFDLCAEVHCQAYSGVEKETELVNMAVDSTRGMVMTYGSKPIDAVYSSNCGGHTQDNIFGNKKTIPYLTGVADMAGDYARTFPLSPYELELWLKDPPSGIYCNIPEYVRSSNFRWVRIYSARQLRDMLEKNSPVGTVSKIVILKRNTSGHADKLKIVGSASSIVIEGELNIRKALGDLRSSMFKIETRYGPDRQPKEFIFYGGGWGHGVGLCQSGACGRAKAGKNYQEILSHYYSRAQFTRKY